MGNLVLTEFLQVCWPRFKEFRHMTCDEKKRKSIFRQLD